MEERTQASASVAFICVLLVAACSGPAEDDEGTVDTGSGSDTGVSDAVDVPVTDTGERPDGSTDTRTSTDTGSKPDGMSTGPHLCPSGRSCLVYSQNDTSDQDALTGKAWFVDPQRPSQRIDLSKPVGGTGPVVSMKVDSTGRYVLFTQGVGDDDVNRLHWADLAAEEAPRVVQLTDYTVADYNYGIAPGGGHIWRKASGTGRVAIAPIDKPTEWVSVDDSDGKQFNQSAMSFGTGGKWAYWGSTMTPDNQMPSYDVLWRVDVSSPADSAEPIVESREVFSSTDKSDWKRWRYFPQTNQFAFQATLGGTFNMTRSDVFVMPAEPGADKTTLLDVAETGDTGTFFNGFTMSPDGSALGVFAKDVQSDAGSTLRDGDITLRIFDPENPETVVDKVALGFGHVKRSVWNDDGSELLVSIGEWGDNAPPPKVWHVDVETAMKTDLTDTVLGDVEGSLLQSSNPSWTFGPEGKLYFRADDSFGPGPGVYRVSVPQADDRQKVSAMTKTIAGAFRFSADGKQLFYKADTEYDGGFNLLAGPLASPSNATILNDEVGSESEFVRHLRVVGRR